MATGHGVATTADGGVLVNTSRMREVAIDPVARTARVAAGARWSDVIPGAAAHGLACLPGSSSGVGVVGYTMGSGFGWLGRRYGFASASVRAAEVVTAEGALVRAGATALGAVNAVISVAALGQVLTNLDRPMNVVGYAVGVSVGVYLGCVADDRLRRPEVDRRARDTVRCGLDHGVDQGGVGGQPVQARRRRRARRGGTQAASGAGRGVR